MVLVVVVVAGGYRAGEQVASHWQNPRVIGLVHVQVRVVAFAGHRHGERAFTSDRWTHDFFRDFFAIFKSRGGFRKQ